MNSLPPEQRTMVTQDDAGSRIEPIPGMGVCDFCTHIPVRWEYPCGLVAVTTAFGVHATDDPWGACDDCHELIELGADAALAQRALDTFVTANGPVPDEIVAMFRDIQAAFFAARTGDARPL